MNDANKILIDENTRLKNLNFALGERITELENANYKLNRDINVLKNNPGADFRKLSIFEKIKHIRFITDPRYCCEPVNHAEYQLRRILRDFNEISDAFLKMAEHRENENQENENDKSV